MINVYRPPSGKVNEGIDLLQSIISELPANIELIIAGDLNIDLSRTNSSSCQAIKHLENVNNLTQLITDSTRITNKSSSIIDHIYTKSNIIQKSGILNLNISDHLPIYAVRKKAKIITKLVSFSCRKLKYFNEDNYKEKLLGYTF